MEQTVVLEERMVYLASCRKYHGEECENKQASNISYVINVYASIKNLFAKTLILR